MNRRSFLKTLTLSMAGLSLARPALATMPALPSGNVLLLLGFDSLGWPYIEPLMESGQLPGLRKLKDTSFYAHLESVTKTCTVPNWTACFTGMTPDMTCVLNNEDWKPIHGSYTLPSRLEAIGVRVGWFVSKSFIGKDPNKNPWAKGIEAATYYRYDVPSYGEDGSRYFESLVDPALDVIDNALATNEKTFIFLHLNPDIYGHWYGSRSEEYLAEAVRCDQLLGFLLNKYPLLPIMVVSDHGFDEPTLEEPNPRQHGRAPFNFLAATWTAGINPKWRGGGATMRDMSNTILRYFGWPYDEIACRMYGKDLRG